MTPGRLVGVALVALMPIHCAMRPEHAWILLAACDVVCVVTAIGLVANWPRVVTIAGLFAITVGVPAIFVGLATTYHLNPTGIVLHVVPPIVGGIMIARHGLPRRAALIAWSVYIVVVAAGLLLAPRRLNINMTNHPWKPLAHVFTIRGTFQLALIALTGVMLFTGELIIRRLLSRSHRR